MESILTNIKNLLGIEEEYEHFDKDLIILINSVFMILNQLGLGPKNGYSIVDKSNIWEEFVMSRTDLEGIRSYMYLKVKLMFDPPNTGYLVESMTKLCSEFEWRLNLQVEGGPNFEGAG